MDSVPGREAPSALEQGLAGEPEAGEPEQGGGDREPSSNGNNNNNNNNNGAAAGEAPEEDQEPPLIPGLPNTDVTDYIFSFLGVRTLFQKQTVSKQFQKQCNKSLKAKKKEGAGVFRTKQQLTTAVGKVCKCMYEAYSDELAEEIAREYGFVMNDWDVSEVVDFSYVFSCQRKFNENIRNWNVGKGRNFKGMFFMASSFTGDLSRWNMSNARNLNDMFYEASSFNGDLSSWDVSQVREMTGMLRHFPAFTKHDVLTWAGWNLTVENRFRGVFGVDFIGR